MVLCRKQMVLFNLRSQLITEGYETHITVGELVDSVFACHDMFIFGVIQSSQPHPFHYSGLSRGG